MASRAARKQTQPVNRKRSRRSSQNGEPVAKRPRQGDAVPTEGVIPMDKRGDVIFSIPRGTTDGISKEDVPPIRLLVSAKVLSVASETFAAMLSPKYLEGQSLSSDDPPTIEFGEDKGETFYILCSLLHHRQVEDLPDDGELLDLVILADKYGCMPSMHNHVSLWLKAIMSATSPTERHTDADFASLLTGLIVSYAIRDANRFRKVSRSLLKSAPSHFFTRACSRPGQHLIPAGVWVYLSEQ